MLRYLTCNTLQRRQPDRSNTMDTSPNHSRRQFHVELGSLFLGGSLVVPLAATARAAVDGVPSDGVCDFQASFMTWDFPYREDKRPHARHNIPYGNMARIQLDALVDVVNRDTGQRERFVLIAACRTEWVYAEDRLFQLPSREYRNIYSLTEQRAMVRGIVDTGEASLGQPVSGDFRSLKIDVFTYPRASELKTPEEIVRATAINRELVARTRIDDPSRPLRYVLEYPIRTMNFQPKTDSFQVDTGPLLVPDFKSGAERAIDRLEMAHVAYNRLDRAEFILRRPTPILDDSGRALCHVLHYCEVREDRAANQIFAGQENA